jgi:hypothetical protein
MKDEIEKKSQFTKRNKKKIKKNKNQIGQNHIFEVEIER